MSLPINDPYLILYLFFVAEPRQRKFPSKNWQNSLNSQFSSSLLFGSFGPLFGLFGFWSFSQKKKVVVCSIQENWTRHTFQKRHALWDIFLFREAFLQFFDQDGSLLLWEETALGLKISSRHDHWKQCQHPQNICRSTNLQCGSKNSRCIRKMFCQSHYSLTRDTFRYL